MGKTDPKSSLENLVEEGIKMLASQQTLNGLTVATAAKTFFGVDDKTAAAIGVGYALLNGHLNETKELSSGNSSSK